MRVLEGDFRAWEPLESRTAATIGVYDGVHLGHQEVLRSLGESGLPPVVVTFRDHPLRLIRPEAAPQLLTDINRRLELLADLGVYATAVIDFDDEFRSVTAEEFVEKVLVAALRVRRVAVGRGFRFGFRQLGDVTLLQELGSLHDFTVDDVAIVEEGVPVRSTVVRALLREGHAAAAHRLLGRPHRFEGTVVPGDRRGRQIGFPTANLDVAPNLLIPGSGVYAAYAHIDNDEHPAVINIGTESVVEAHLLDFSGDLYGKRLALDLIVRLRSERKFAGIDELVAAIGNDVQSARHVLEGLR